MKVTRPITINAANLIATNITEADAGEYAATATYAAGARAIYTVGASATHHLYESLQAGNIGHPLTDEEWWLDLGATNRYAMFDQVNGTKTTGGASINVTVQVDGRADGIGLLNLTGESVRIIATSGGATIYDQTFSLVSDSGITSWYEYFAEEISYVGDLVRTDLPLNLDPKIQVIITSTAGSTACGTMLVGQTRDLGNTLRGVRTGITDYSRKEQDDFGNYAIVERSYSKRGVFKMVTDNDQVDSIAAMLATYRATPVLWIGTDTFTSSWIYGFYKDFAVELAFNEQSYLTLEIEGLT